MGAERFIREHGFVRVAFADPLKRYAKDIYDFTDQQLWGPSEMRNLPDKRYPREHTWKVVKDEDGIETGWSCVCCGADRPVGGSPSIEQCYLTARYALQLLGTEFGRHCYPDTWVDYAIRVAKALKGGGCYYDMKRGLGYVSYVDGPNTLAKTDVVISDVRFLNEIRGIHRGGGYVIRIKPPKPKGSSESWRKHQSEVEQEGIPDSEFDAVLVNEKTGFDPFWANIDEAFATIQKMASS